MQLWNDATGEPVDQASDLNYVTTDRCDSCGVRAEGTMFHAAGATGRVCEVLFLCFTCQPVEESDDEDYDDSMDGDHDSAMASAGWGTDEDYGYFGGEEY